MVVAVEGSLNACPNADAAVCDGIATQIRFRNNLEGPITGVNRLTNTLQVMGRDVVVDESTVIDGATELADLAVGDMVSVSGLTERLQLQDRDRIRARLLERTGTFADGTTPIAVHGVVSDVDLAQGTCIVDGVQVRFLGLPAGDLPPGGVTDGQFVKAEGRSFGNGLLTADRIRLRDRISYPDASLVELEGYVADFVSQADFMVDGQRVDASTAFFRNGTAADLVDGAKVEVEGTMVAGVLLARKVIFRLEANAQIVAPIQSMDPIATSLVVLGQSVKTTPLTMFVDRAAGTGGGPLRTIAYDDLLVDDRVDVRAYKDAAGALVATRVVRTEPDDLLIAKGPVDAKVPVTGLTLLGIDVVTGAATRYRDADGLLITADDFYGQVQVPPAVPTVVRAQGVATAFPDTVDATRATSTHGELVIAPQ